jgi:hypothetical protein
MPVCTQCFWLDAGELSNNRREIAKCNYIYRASQRSGYDFQANW